MTDKQQLAKRLYLTQNKTQKEIALEVGVSERTVYSWVHQYAWDKLRLAAYTAPITISGNLCSQLVEMQNTIAAREPGSRFPTSQEMDVMRKMILCIDTMKKYPSLSQSIQVMETFRNYVRPLNPKFTKDLAHYSEEFLSGESVRSFAPHQPEYGIENIAPTAPFYDELDGDEPCDHTAPPKQHIPCPDMDHCLHIGSCTYPHCQTRAWEERKPQSPAVPSMPQPVNPAPSEASAEIPGTTAPPSFEAASAPDAESAESSGKTGSIPAIPTIENIKTGENPAILQPPYSSHRPLPAQPDSSSGSCPR